MTAELIAANPWAAPFAPHFSGPAFAAARAEAGRARLARGALAPWLADVSRAAPAASAELGAALGVLDLSGDAPLEALDLAGLSLPFGLALSSEVVGDVSLDGMVVAGPATFLNLSVGGALTAQNAAFLGGARFDGAALGGRADFSAMRSLGFVAERCRTADMWFREAEIFGRLSFDHSVFAGDVGLHHVRVAGAFSCRAARFEGNLGVEASRFDGAVDADGARVSGRLFTAGAAFSAPSGAARLHAATARRRPHLRVIAGRKDSA